MPANVSVIIMDPGNNSLCSDPYIFTINGVRREHGTLIYYAVQTMNQARTATEWLRLINAGATRDRDYLRQAYRLYRLEGPDQPFLAP